jgi:hypothetical protein
MVEGKNYIRVYVEIPQSDAWERHDDEGRDGSLNDKLFEYLGQLGYTGSLTDRLAEYWDRNQSGFTYRFPFSLN